MKKFALWISSKFIKNHERINDLKVRARYGELEGWASIVINILLFVIKMLIGLSIKSISLIADAVHTLADSATSAVVIIGFKVAKKPSDKEHPFGHGRMESVATLIIAVMLFVISVELLQKSIYSIMHPRLFMTSSGIILLITVTLIIKELMSRFSYALGDIIDSKALAADALHHRSDVIATGLVVVALITSRFGYNRIDGVMGIFVSSIIFYSAYSIAKAAINPLLGEAPSKETIKKIEELAKAHKGVLGVHDIIYHKYGQTSIISLHIEVSDKESLSDVHTLSEEIEEAIMQKMGGMVVVHNDPVNKEHPKYEIIVQAIKKVISEDKRLHSFHELRVVSCRSRRGADKCKVIFDIVLEEDVDEQETYDIICFIRERFKDMFPEMEIVVKAEPKYVYNL